MGRHEKDMKKATIGNSCIRSICCVFLLAGAYAFAATDTFYYYWKSEHELRLWKDSDPRLIRGLLFQEGWKIIPESTQVDNEILRLFRWIYEKAPNEDGLKYKLPDYVIYFLLRGQKNGKIIFSSSRNIAYFPIEYDSDHHRWIRRGEIPLKQFFELNKDDDFIKIFYPNGEEKNKNWQKFWSDWIDEYVQIQEPRLFVYQTKDFETKWLSLDYSTNTDDIRSLLFPLDLPVKAPGPVISQDQEEKKSLSRRSFFNSNKFLAIYFLVIFAMAISAGIIYFIRRRSNRSEHFKRAKTHLESDPMGRPEKPNIQKELGDVRTLCHDILYYLTKGKDELVTVRDLFVKDQKEKGSKEESMVAWIQDYIDKNKLSTQEIQDLKNNLSEAIKEISNKEEKIRRILDDREKKQENFNHQVEEYEKKLAGKDKALQRWESVRNHIEQIEEIKALLWTGQRESLDYSQDKSSEIPIHISFLVLYSLIQWEKAVFHDDDWRQKTIRALMIANLRRITAKMSESHYVFNGASMSGFKNARELIERHYPVTSSEKYERSERPHENSRLFQKVLARLRDTSNQRLDFGPFYFDADDDGKVHQAM